MPPTRKCECGREYEVMTHKLLEREQDSYYCECGHELLRWNGLFTYSVRLTKDILVKKSFTNGNLGAE
jgi:hypothetical protein